MVRLDCGEKRKFKKGKWDEILKTNPKVTFYSMVWVNLRNGVNKTINVIMM